MTLSRRQFVLAGAATATCPRIAFSQPGSAEESVVEHLIPAPGETELLGPGKATAVWAYNGAVPGPAFRLKLGQRVNTVLENRLGRPTTVHWHGMRAPNGMDGVPALTQLPVSPGGRFHYAFEAKNPGTFWYHPHFQSAEQLDRGLHGVIVVEDDRPPQVDRDLVWLLDDWRLDSEGQIVEDFGDLHDVSHQGRIGNTATLNGRVPETFELMKGERIRLRLVNVANAWIFGLEFTGHSPRVIALDGHAVTPYVPQTGLVVIGPAQRVDLILDATGSPGDRFEVVDRYYRNRSFKLLDLVYSATPLRSEAPPLEPLSVPELPEPDLTRATRHEVTFAGGAMGGMRSARFRGEETGIRQLAREGKVWAVNGVVASRHDERALIQMRLGRSYLVDFINDTAFPHPVHLHGHPMKLLMNADREPAQPVWRDTLLIAPRTKATVAMVADNPGKWMLHCHIPEHQEAGMMAVVSVA
ncbi:MAG TPA: multicopper oxidase family protein [Gammaproteobacteria bacterium]|nr:multicopper oxidase family protein [Gammaproteobacteria bacterium]